MPLAGIRTECLSSQFDDLSAVVPRIVYWQASLTGDAWCFNKDW